MTTEWDDTPWAGTTVSTQKALVHVTPSVIPVTLRPEIIDTKAVYGGAALNAYLNDIPLNSWMYGDQQARMARFLRVYKVGWFYKAGRKISEAIANLDWSISDGDVESDRRESVIPRPDLDIPFDSLDPIEQLIRLLERPNPYQTGRALFQKTQVRRDFAGTAAWYLEGGEGEGLPTALYGVSPARLTPARDNGRLIGWVLDKDKPGGGTPFSADEIVTFPMGSADDDDEAGVGVVEAVFSESPIGDLIARHSTDLLTTGGRLAGMLSPKDRALTPDEFEDAKRAWRNVASDPNAARRLLLFPEPMEYSQGASTPAEIGIPELAELNRDNILTAFPISPYQLGVPMPGGLNSGQLRREDRKDYWEGTIHPRVEALTEVIQVKLLSRYERVMGRTFDFDFDEPNLDDAPTLIEKVGAYKGLISIGLDPKEALAAVELDHIKWNGLPPGLDPSKPPPAPVAPPEQGGVVATAGDTSRGDPSSAQIPVAKARIETREAVAERSVRKGIDILTTFLTEQRDRLSQSIRDTLPKTKAARKDAGDDWWDGPAEDKALKDALRSLYLEVGLGSLQVVADQLDRTVLSPQTRRVLADLLEQGGERITAINETTRDAIKAQLTEGVRRGYSISQLIEGVESEGYQGVYGALLDNGVSAFDPYRAELISRTETMLSYNRAAITSYDSFGVREVQAIDGDGDAECAARNGQTYSIDDALAIEDHPNGTLDWIPVLDKAIHQPFNVSLEPTFKVEPHFAIHQGSVTVEQPTIEVHPTPVSVEAPVVNVDAPVVHVQNDVQTPDVKVINEVVTPSVTMPEVKVFNEVVSPSVTVQNDVAVPAVNVTNEVVTPSVHVTNEVQSPDVVVNVPEPKPVKRTIKRDRQGQITEIVDGG